MMVHIVISVVGIIMIRLEKNIRRKIISVFHGLIKLDLEDFMSPLTPIRKTLQCLSWYGIYIGNEESELYLCVERE